MNGSEDNRRASYSILSNILSRADVCSVLTYRKFSEAVAMW